MTPRRGEGEEKERRARGGDASETTYRSARGRDEKDIASPRRERVFRCWYNRIQTKDDVRAPHPPTSGLPERGPLPRPSSPRSKNVLVCGSRDDGSFAQAPNRRRRARGLFFSRPRRRFVIRLQTCSNMSFAGESRQLSPPDQTARIRRGIYRDSSASDRRALAPSRAPRASRPGLVYTAVPGRVIPGRSGGFGP